MSSSRDEGPVYYREIQKNAYLKRIPNESTGSKLLPLGHKKPPLKPMWTQFCVHNGRTPFLEQYPEAECPSALAHRPVWRACLKSARHVTASVRPRGGEEYDFLVDTDHGPVRMLAPDWDTMQDWVRTLRAKLHELKIVNVGENVYCPAPGGGGGAGAGGSAGGVGRLAARDPTSPLPPTPPHPVPRVPGIEIITPRPTQTQPVPEQQTQQVNTQPQTQPEPQPEPTETTTTSPDIQIATLETENIDISNWEPDYPSTSSSDVPKVEPKKGVTKICGQNVCLDDSILKRNVEATDSDEEFFAEIDRLNASVENLDLDCDENFKQRLVVNDKHGGVNGDTQTNVTVIQVSNKPPHTAIPILGSDGDVFNFNLDHTNIAGDEKSQGKGGVCSSSGLVSSGNISVDPEDNGFKQRLPVNNKEFVNIVTTEGSGNDNYDTVFTKESDYGHLSLTTTVNLTGDERNGVYERLCMASTSNDNSSPLPLRRLKANDKVRKSSLPNLDTSDATYEYLFPNNNKNTTITLTTNKSLVEVNSNFNGTSNVASTSLRTNLSAINSEVTDTRVNTSVTRIQNANEAAKCENTRSGNSENTRLGNSDNSRSTNSDNTRSGNNEITRVGNSENTRSNNSGYTRSISSSENSSANDRSQANAVTNVSDSSVRVLRSNVERSHSQNACDRMPRRDLRRENSSPQGDKKNEKQECNQNKPIWKRGLTELSLLSKLRAKVPLANKRTDGQANADGRSATTPVKVVRRSRQDGAHDPSRRRSSSLSNGQPSQPSNSALLSLRTRQAMALRAALLTGAAVHAVVSQSQTPIFADYDNAVWVACWCWDGSAARWGGRGGDRVAAVGGAPPRTAAHAHALAKAQRPRPVDILFHRVPLAKIYVINKRDMEPIGIKLDGECNITSIEATSPAAAAGLSAAARWAVTEVNNRPINLLKGGEDEMIRLSAHGTEVSILLQPSPLVKKLRQAIKASKPLLSLR